VTLYWGYLFILRLFRFGYILYCVCFNLYCGGFILFCNVWVCVCVGFVMRGLGVCSFVICGCLVICNMYTITLRLTWQVFPCFFLSCKANAGVKLAKMVHGPHASKLVVICVVLLLFVLFYVLFVCKCVLYYCHQVLTQLQLTNTSYILGHKRLVHLSAISFPNF